MIKRKIRSDKQHFFFYEKMTNFTKIINYYNKIGKTMIEFNYTR